MSRVDKKSFERAMQSVADNTGFQLFTIDTGCQVTGCMRRSRVVVLLQDPASGDAAVSFVCSKHAKHIEDKMNEDT